MLADEFVDVFMSFVGRVGEPFRWRGGEGGFNLEDGVAGGVELTADEDLSATRCGRGLIGLPSFSTREGDGCGLRCSFPPSSESDEELKRRREPTLLGLGDGGFAVSVAVALGRSFGSAEPLGAVLGRRREPLVVGPVAAGAWGVASGDFMSSVEDRLCCVESRLRVIPLASGVDSRLGRSPELEMRVTGWALGVGVEDWRLVSFVFLETLGTLVGLVSSGGLSLLLTPAIIALPTEARVKDWRMEELLVVGLEGLGSGLVLPL